MHPTLAFGRLELPSYTALFVLAMVGALLAMRAEARRHGWSVRAITGLVLGATALGFLGGHLMYALTRWDLPRAAFWRVLFNVGYGSVWFGGVLAAWPLAHLFARRHAIPTLRLYDSAALSILVAQMVGRVGCLLGGCCYGSPTDLPWGVVLTSRDYGEARVHPTPLYESLYLLALFAWLWHGRARRRHDGQTAALYLVLAASGRFLLEFLRGDTIRGFVLGWLSTSQAIAIALASSGLFLYWLSSSVRSEHRVEHGGE
jgi:phosphatidylglycerol---prolipoprotein diacylglyceryl transferase